MGGSLTGVGCRNGRHRNRRPTIRAGRAPVNAGDATGGRYAMVQHCWRNAMNDPARPPRPDELDPIETASRDEITALQLTRMRSTLERAYDNVPHYKRRFDDAGVGPADLESLDDLARFPFTVKDDLRLNYPFELFAVPRERVIRIHASSGTTGHSHRRRLHQERPRHLGRPRRPLSARRRRALRRHGARRLRLWPLHRRPRPPRRCREAGLHRDPSVGAGSPNARCG